ncbi:hypothetical protein WR25_22395 [Diploscapter pachys]|uniref:Bestrophin homolog n=1 Tax=Diploscapter pachys TaxID=2018661 RepID=A0A2A2JJQ8_9BILA|nr:hypothetical protein WR25_22395 [Diploscapter pachys]
MRVRRRFPNIDAIMKAGFIFEDEVKVIDDIDIVYNKYWAPINWAVALCHKMHKAGNLVAPPSLNACININLYVPIMSIMEFIFIVSWMKVAEALLNPLGEDDDDLELNFLIDKNISTGMAIVDRTQGYIPTLKKDIFSDAFYNPVYSEESQKNGGAERTLIGSAATVTLAEPDEKISMVKIDPRKSIDFGQSLRYRPTATMKRKISSALNLKRPSSSQSANAAVNEFPPPSPPPSALSAGGRFFSSLATPQRFEHSNAFANSSPQPPKSPSFNTTNSMLMKVDEEALERSSSEESVHSIIKAELDPNHSASKKPKDV